MELTCTRASIAEHSTPLLVLGAFEGSPPASNAIRLIDEALTGQISEIFATGDFTGREGQTLVVYPPNGRIPATRILLVGLGKRDGFDVERLRRAGATAVKQAAKLSTDRFSTTLHQDSITDRVDLESAGRAIAEGVELGSYAFRDMK
jgi:leucyl aminopeptidase